MNKILLVYPKLGFAGDLTRHHPLSLLYAAIGSIEKGFDVDIVDARLCPDSWQKVISKKIDLETILVGISVMSGAPIRNALDISRFLKENFPAVKIVWGGPHALFNGYDILDEPAVDYVISGYGSKPLAALASAISEGASENELQRIPGLIFRRGNERVLIPPENDFEYVDYKKIPYKLIEKDLPRYGQLDSDARIFSLYSAMGCPYKCAFCSSPAQYKDYPKKFTMLPVMDVVDHIEFVHKCYGANYIYFIDDDSFVDISNVEAIIEEINRRGFKVELGFRGARINEIKKMSDEFLGKLASAGTNIMHIGAESGSQRMLDLIRKNCTVDDIVEVNKKMARHPEIMAAYNWLVGLPGETLEDLEKTRSLILQIIRDNPKALIFIPNILRPIPRTELFEIALGYGYSPPVKLDDWIEVEAEGDCRLPWVSSKHEKMINMIKITSFFIDKKLFKVNTGDTFRFIVLRLIAMLYFPFAYLRFKFGFTRCLVEYSLFQWYSKRKRR